MASQFNQHVTDLVMMLELSQQVHDLPEFWSWDQEQVEAFQSAIKCKILHDQLKFAARELKAEPSEVAVLTRARKARNALFHKMPYLPLHDPRRLRLPIPTQAEQRNWEQEASDEALSDALEQIRAHVYGLTPGCALVGSWLFQLLEQELDQPFPQEFFEAYSKQLGSWVLAPVWDLLPRLDCEPTTPITDGAIRTFFPNDM